MLSKLKNLACSATLLASSALPTSCGPSTYLTPAEKKAHGMQCESKLQAIREQRQTGKLGHKVYSKIPKGILHDCYSSERTRIYEIALSLFDNMNFIDWKNVEEACSSCDYQCENWPISEIKQIYKSAAQEALNGRNVRRVCFDPIPGQKLPVAYYNSDYRAVVFNMGYLEDTKKAQRIVSHEFAHGVQHYFDLTSNPNHDLDRNDIVYLIGDIAEEAARVAEKGGKFDIRK